MSFRELLQQTGWTQAEPWVYRKNDGSVVFDTGSWLEIGTTHTPRIFDVPVPEAGREQWTLKLVEHLSGLTQRQDLRRGRCADEPGA